MNPLDSITVERLKQLEFGLQQFGDNFGWASVSEQLELVQMALAAKRSEKQHVRLEVNYGVNNWVQCSEQAYERCKAKGKVVRKLYEHPTVIQLPDGWVTVPIDMIQDYRDVKNAEVAHAKVLAEGREGSRWDRDLIGLVAELEAIDAIIAAAPKPE